MDEMSSVRVEDVTWREGIGAGNYLIYDASSETE